MKIDWKEVEGIVSLLTKRQRRRDEIIVLNPSTNPPTPNPNKMSIVLPLKNNDSIIDDLVKRMKELMIKLAKFEKKKTTLRTTNRIQIKECRSWKST